MNRAGHWNERYRTTPSDQLTWFTPEPVVSLSIVIDLLGTPPDAAVIDVGGGDSVLVDRLVGRGFTDVTVLDVSEVALDAARARVGDAARWIRADLLTWKPRRQWDLWHDRAVFHFLTSAQELTTYRSHLHEAVKPGGHVVIATFAADGPTSCSGLPVRRYTPHRLEDTIGVGFDRVMSRREEHVTPAGACQPFTWVVFQRSAGSD